MPEKVTVLFANEIFYAAFANRDLDAMNDVWAEGPQVTCIHPGWNPLTGRDDVMNSWADILENESSPAVRCRNAHVTMMGGMAVVICHEEIDDAFLVATNIFVRQDGRWKMVHHQAGPGQEPDEEEAEASDTLQ